MRRLPYLTSIAILTGIVATAWQASADTAVTFCGQEIHGSGALTGDLDCTGFDGYAVNVFGGTLRLGGFTLSGGDFGSVHCPGNCKVVGPGTITGSEFAGIVAFGRLRTSNVDLTNHVAYGLEAFKSCTIEGGTISGNGDGVVAGGTAKLRGVTVTGNAGYGVRAANAVQLKGSSVSFNGDEGVTATRKVTVQDSAIQANAEHGVRAGSEDCSTAGAVKLKNSTVTGNGSAPDCGWSEICADVVACRRVSVDDASTCGTSYVQNSGFPGDDWDVCTGD